MSSIRLWPLDGLKKELKTYGKQINNLFHPLLNPFSTYPFFHQVESAYKLGSNSV